jgi:hypothetical protein
MIILAGIIWFAVYIEHWAYKRSEQQKDKKTKHNVLVFLKKDLEQRMRFIDESSHTKDNKPFSQICEFNYNFWKAYSNSF